MGMRATPKIIVVGGGIAGLMATLRTAMSGVPVLLISNASSRASTSSLAQGGLNAAIDSRREGDTPEKHFRETIEAGIYLADQESVRQMCLGGPEILSLFDQMGVLFNRTSSGRLDFRQLGPTLYHRTAFAGLSVGHHLMTSLEEQMRRLEHDQKVTRLEGWEFLSVVKAPSNRVRGLVAMNRNTMEIKAFPADAIIFATGGCGTLFGHTTQSQTANGVAASILFQQGAVYANGEFIQFHPTTIPGFDKAHLVSTALLSLGGRLWVPRHGRPWYFLEEKYPRALPAMDVMSREIHHIIFEKDLGVNGKPLVHLDLTEISEAAWASHAPELKDWCRRWVGLDPTVSPLMVAPAVHYSMGGLWVDARHRTTLPGVFAAGECDSQYHGASQLPGNSLLSCAYSGIKSSLSALEYALGLEESSDDASLLYDEEKRQYAVNNTFFDFSGNENPHLLYRELTETMNRHMTCVRKNDALVEVDEKIEELSTRLKRVTLSDRGNFANRELLFARQLSDMLVLAKVIVKSALWRNESRGSHYKPAFSKCDDARFLKVTKASFVNNQTIHIDYEDVSLKYLKPG